MKAGTVACEAATVPALSDWVSFQDTKWNFPRQTAAYILKEYKPRGRDHGRDRVVSWAKKLTCDVNCSICHIARLYDMYLDEHNKVCVIRRDIRKQKKKKIHPCSKTYKYDIQVSRTMEEALAID